MSGIISPLYTSGTSSNTTDEIQKQFQYTRLGMLPISDPVFDDLTPELKKLMSQRPPRNLNGEVSIPPGPAKYHGGFSSIYQGIWDGKQVNLLKTPAICFLHNFFRWP
jgi:hypothetical protein